MMTIAQRQRRVDLVVAASSLAGGVALLVTGAGYGLIQAPGVGAGFMPMIAGALMTGTSLIWLVGIWRARGEDEARRAADAHPLTDSAIELLIVDGIDEEDDDVELPDRRGWLRIAVIVGGMVAAAMLLPLLGYTLSVALLLFAVLKFVSERRWWLAALIAIGAALASLLVFQVWLGTRLPSSSIPGLELLGI